MAMINKIRDNSWLVVTLLGVALAAFILTEVIQGRQNYSSNDQNVLGSVNGMEIDRTEFDTYRDVIYNRSTGDPNQVSAQIWNYFVEKALVSDIAGPAGLGIHKSEMEDLQYGANLSPVITQRFGNPQTGQIDRQNLNSIKTAIESGEFQPEQRLYWSQQQKEIIKERQQAKISNLLSKAIYTPKWMAEMAFKDGNKRIDIAYVRVPYDKVDANDVTVTDEDYKSYLAKNAKKYWQAEEARVIDYVAFDVIPSAQDSIGTFNSMNNLVAGFASAANDSAFVMNSGGNYAETYYKKSELPAVVSDRLFSDAIGTVVGPYIDGGVYTIAKILDRKSVPDSVKARHILIKPESVGSVQAAEAKVDSLIGVLNSGAATFDQLASVFGQDATSTKGGDLGYFAPGMMVKPFADMAFYKGVQGKPEKVYTQFGWHVLEVTGKKFLTNETGAKVAFIGKRIEPSKETQSAYRSKAIDLMNKADNLESLGTEARNVGMVVQQTPPLKSSDYTLAQLGSGQDVRALVQWAYKAKKDVVNKDVFVFGDQQGGYFDSKYVIAALSSVIPAGAPTLEANRDKIAGFVLNAKKAAYLKGKIQASTDLSAIASEYGVSVDTARNVNMLSTSLGQIGSEPALVGAAFGVDYGTQTGPIEGNTGVLVGRPLSAANDPEVPADLTLFKKQASSQMQGQVRQRLVASMKKDAAIDDARTRLGM